MTKYLRILGDCKMNVIKLEGQKNSVEKQLESLRGGMPAQIDRAVGRAVLKREAELRNLFDEV